MKKEEQQIKEITGSLSSFLKILKMRTNPQQNPGEVEVPGDMESVSKKINEYVHIMGRRRGLIPKDTKIEDMTFDDYYSILSKIIDPPDSNSASKILGLQKKMFWESLRPFIRDRIFDSPLAPDNQFKNVNQKDKEDE